jgi:hypothetical protein
MGRRGDGTPASMPWYGGHLALRAHETGDGPAVISERYDAVQDALAFQGWQARREPWPWPRGGGEQARTDAEAARVGAECGPDTNQ